MYSKSVHPFAASYLLFSVASQPPDELTVVPCRLEQSHSQLQFVLVQFRDRHCVFDTLQLRHGVTNRNAISASAILLEFCDARLVNVFDALQTTEVFSN